MAAAIHALWRDGERGLLLMPGNMLLGERPTRFYASIEISSLRAASEMDKLVKEVIQHLTSLDGSNVQLTLDIAAQIPRGVPENIERSVSENCRVLGFKSQEFENQ